MHSVADALEHEPSRPLSYPKILADFIAADTVLAVADKPHGREPFVQRYGRVFEKCTYLDGELPPAIKALPDHSGLQKRQSFGLH